MMLRRTIRCTGLLVVVGAIFPVNAYAYLDPGTGSIILQGLLAAIAAGSIAIRMYWRRIAAFFRGERQPVQTESLLDGLDDEPADARKDEKSNPPR